LENNEEGEKIMITQEKLKEILDYNPETGIFTRLVRMGQRGKVGDVVGSPHNEGYLVVRIRGKSYLLHRLAFLYMAGYLPENQVDHKNGCGTDNRWLNLREVSNTCNQQNCKMSKNNKSGFNGVSWYKQTGKWLARIKINNKAIHLGCYETATDAAIARVEYEDNCPGWTCNFQSANRVKLREMGAI